MFLDSIHQYHFFKDINLLETKGGAKKDMYCNTFSSSLSFQSETCRYTSECVK